MKRKGGGTPKGTPLAVALAILSSVGSIAVAVAGGWQRGAVVSDQLLLAGVSVIAVLAAQLLPALGTRLGGLTKAYCLALWLICVAYTAWGHAWYLLAAQERAGMARAEAVKLTQTPLVVSTHDAATILNDKARVTELLARLQTGVCDASACVDRQRFRMAALNERLAALDAEAQAVADVRQARLRQDEQQRQAREDLVGIRLAGSLGVPYVTVTWVMALTFALVLEGVGCFCWAVVLRTETPVLTAVTADDYALTKTAPPPEVTVVTPVDVEGGQPTSPAEVIPEAHDRDDDSLEPLASHGRHFAEDVARVTEAMRDSTIKLTVTEVRLFLQCGQRHAREIRRFIANVPNQRSPNPV
jgi:hypothetical protein